MSDTKRPWTAQDAFRRAQFWVVENIGDEGFSAFDSFLYVRADEHESVVEYSRRQGFDLWGASVTHREPYPYDEETFQSGLRRACTILLSPPGPQRTHEQE